MFGLVHSYYLLPIDMGYTAEMYIFCYLKTNLCWSYRTAPQSYEHLNISLWWWTGYLTCVGRTAGVGATCMASNGVHTINVRNAMITP